MLSISTIPEALSELGKRTGRAWTDSEIFDAVTSLSLEIHAAAPITAKTVVQEFVLGEGMKKRYGLPAGHAVLAVLLPWQVGQLWIGGETNTEFPSDHDNREGQYHWFTEPVRVTREQVRIKAETLRRILRAWTDAAAAGPDRWIADATRPGGMRYLHGPEWMFPSGKPAQTPAGQGEVPSPPTASHQILWQDTARKYADEEWARRHPATNPPKLDIARKIAARFEIDGITGPRGRLTAETIDRQALRDWEKPKK